MQVQVRIGIILILAAFSVPAESHQPESADKSVQESTVITGTFARLCRGHYFLTVFLEQDGNITTAWAPTERTPGLDIFLFRHRWQLVDATISDVIHDGNFLFPTVVDANGGGERYNEWYAAVSEELGISTAQEFLDHFGDPAMTEELFDLWTYVNGSPPPETAKEERTFIRHAEEYRSHGQLLDKKP